ncbi:hypothetical protein [Flavobacterium sp. ACN6]|uniref:hypothetical protein n=1 Tax=Flavobacterium sp. ACN6 TaxID=1920426 RepID=UPI000BB368BE|nr:hypothetical protein [Flavobacterium sp. ACN6]PBJ15713.1 hypothetical protein BSF42_01160 [Flavobacterium sp. ACN6]
MKIIESSFFKPRKCEYGNFEIIPDEGWEFSQTFIDYESKLLIVSLSIIDKTKWENLGYNGTVIPTKQYKIDLNTLRILECEEWKEYFNYNKIEIISDDKKYKLITQRVFKPENNNDSIIEELYDNVSGDLISSSRSVAFREDKYENLLENKYRSERELEERIRIYNAKPNLAAFYTIQINQLKNQDVIIYYYDAFDTFKLTFLNDEFVLSKGDIFPSKQEDWQSLYYDEIAVYSTIDEFWKEFSKDEKWYLKYNLHYGFDHKPLVLAKQVTEYLNELREEQKSSFKEYEKINEWQGIVWSDEYKKKEIKQWCSNCFKPVNYNGRYPKYICQECASKDAYDADGNVLEFSNLGMSGGFKAITKNKEGEIIKENDTDQFCDCIIDGKLFFAQEARFGGIVIQLKDSQ